MNPDQQADMQHALEQSVFEISDIQWRIMQLEKAARHEDTRKRIFRTFVVVCLSLILALEFSQCLGHV